MLSKTQNKYIRSLTHQKYRKQHNVFVAEGDKIAREWLASSTQIQMIVALEQWVQQHEELVNAHREATLHVVEEHVLASISTLQTPNQVLLVVQMPEAAPVMPNREWCIALDDLQDPGNMGTIIRIADWFGVKHVVCSRGCVDIYNPKVIQSAMGSHLRVHFHHGAIEELIKLTDMPVLAAVLGGENVYKMNKPEYGILVIGNESRGVSEDLVKLATNKIMIPRVGGAESLNAAVSAGILCALLVSC